MDHPAAPPSGAAPARLCLLALATSGEWCSVALYRHESGVDDSDCLSERLGAGQSERILAMVRELCVGAQMKLDEVDAIAFDAGPGSFTGLRVGCAVAQGLGFALDRPLVPVDALETLAWQRVRASRCADVPVLAAIDARMDELYVAMYRVRPHASTPVGTLIAPRLVARAEFVAGISAAWPDAHADAEAQARIEPARTLLAGNAWHALGLAREWTAHHRLAHAPYAPAEEDAYVRADALAELAHRTWQHEDARVHASRAAPRYVRDKVALDRDEQHALRLRRAAAAAERGTGR